MIKAQPQDNQNRYRTKYKTLDIKPITSTEMVSPTENETAMMACNIGTYYMRKNQLNDAEKFLGEAIDLDSIFVGAMDHFGLV